MKKNFTLLLVIVSLAGLLIYLKYSKTNSNFEEVKFNVSEVNDIGKISITDKNGIKTIIAKKGMIWTVNDSKYADKNKIILLLETLNKLETELPVGDSMRKMAIMDLRMHGKEIMIYNQKGEELKTFYLGNQMGIGNVAIIKEDGVIAADPYIIKIPGIKTTNLKHRFPASPEAWYSMEVFATTIDKIKSIKVEFHESPKFSFQLTKDEDIIKIDPLLNSVKVDKPLNRERVLQFLLEFESKNYDKRILDDSIINYLKNIKPTYTIKTEDVLNEKRAISLYRIPAKFQGMDLTGGSLDAAGNKLPFNIEKYWAYNSYTNEYVLAQHYVFGPILLPYSYFFEGKK